MFYALSLRSVVPALLRPCAPSSLRSFVPCLSLCLTFWLAAPDAWAGSYSGPVYSGGTYYNLAQGPLPATYNDGPMTQTINGNSYTGWGGSGGGTAGASASGTIKATFTWQPAYGQTMTTDPPPTQVIALDASYATVNGVNSPPSPAHSVCNDGIGQDASLMTANYPNATPPYSVTYGTCQDIKYSVVAGGATVTRTLAPQAIANGNTTGCFASAFCSASISPVFVIPSGATKDSSGNYNILVGQGCTSSLVGIPTNCSVSNWQWGVTGTTFQTWQSQTPAIGSDPFNPDASYYVSGPGRSDQPTARWYWNDLQLTQQEIVTCTATVTPPTGQGSPFSVTATKPVTVLRPIWTATGYGGTMQVNTALAASSGSFAFYAGVTPGSGALGGMDWLATVTSPNAALFGNGSLILVQLAIPNRSYTAYSVYPFTSTHNDPENGQEGLDTAYPYPWGTSRPGWQGYESEDSPWLNLTGVLSATLNDQFEDYLMYFAPGSTQCVPLAYFVWSLSGNVTLPASGSWATWTGSAGSITPSGKFTPFLKSNSFPMWTQIDTYPLF